MWFSRERFIEAQVDGEIWCAVCIIHHLGEVVGHFTLNCFVSYSLHVVYSWTCVQPGRAICINRVEMVISYLSMYICPECCLSASNPITRFISVQRVFPRTNTRLHVCSIPCQVLRTLLCSPALTNAHCTYCTVRSTVHTHMYVGSSVGTARQQGGRYVVLEPVPRHPE